MDKTFHWYSEGVNLAVEHLNSILSSRQPKKMYNNDKWFDEECKNLRKKLRNLSRQKHREFENKSHMDKLPYLLGEIPQCVITAARCVTCCYKKRATCEEQTPL
jgi:hypothetical protein